MSDATITEDLADLYDNAPCGYVSVFPNNRIVKINQTLLNWLGRSEGELVDKPIHALLSFGGKIAYETHLAPLLRLQGFVHEIALDIVDASDAKIPVIANASERRGKDGEHLFTRLTMFKAVDRRTFERSLIEARINAEARARSEHEAIELRDQFIAVLGHDLRNPLAAVLAGISLLQRRGALPDREEMILREMAGSVARANALIDDVLDFARGKLGNGVIVARDPNRPLGPVLELVLGEIRAVARNRTFEKRIDLKHPVDCDPDRIGQMASNLLGNAVSHGAPETPIILTAITTDKHFQLSVTNGGSPIPADVRDQLFQPFFRGGDGTKGKGLGLGLFIVKEIASAHGGSMTIVSDKEKTIFTFTMPRLAAASEASHD